MIPVEKKNNFKYDLLLWSAVWLFYIFFFSYNSDNTKYILLFSTALIPITAFASYTMLYWLIPKYLTTKKYLWFGIYSLFSLLFTTFWILLFIIVSIGYFPELKFDDLPPMSRNYLFAIILVYLVVTLVSYASLWKKNSQIALKNTELQKQLLATKFRAKEQELTYLKNQIHPHFLFNTLNTIYGLALKKSKNTPDVILKLSNLLDYILYQASKPKVAIRDEITHLEQYIDLEKIRFSDTLLNSFSKEVENQELLLPPMLLLPFVENAFKHGSIVDGFLKVEIHLSVTDNVLHFSIKNTHKASTSKEGLGLKNIKERLEILYPKNFDLQIEKKPQWYEVNLRINLLKQNKA